MKKELLVTTSVFLLIATPAFAKSDKANNGQGEEHRSDKAQEVLATHDNETHSNNAPVVTPTEVTQQVVALDVEDLSITPSVTITPSASPTCDPNAQWKNHGAYVSCVAHTHQGGKVTSIAARSDVGKEHHGTPTPSMSPSASPTATLTPSVTPPVTSAEQTLAFNSFLDIQGLLKKITKFFSRFHV